MRHGIGLPMQDSQSFPYPGSCARIVTAAALATTALLAGCSASHDIAGPAAATAPSGSQPIAIESGFLDDYSGLKPSDQSPSLRMYRDDAVRGGFEKVFVRPVQVWRSAEKQLADIPDADLQFLADSFYQAVTDPLRDDFELADKPGPGVLEISLALTLVVDKTGKVDFFSTEVPLPQILERLKDMGPATQAFVRDCALEAEFAELVPAKSIGGKPAKSKRVVKAAFFDTRRGSDTPKDSVRNWEDLEKLFRQWGSRLDGQLAAVKAGTYAPAFTVGKK